MPNYTFMTPELQALLQAIDNAKQQQPQTPADYVTDQTIQGNDAKNAAFAQQQQAAAQAQALAQAQMQMQQLQAQMPQQEPLLNPTTKAILDQLVNYKDMYENADAVTKAANPKVTDAAQLGAAADSLRLSSHKAADDIRQLAASLGVDLTGYENVGYEDAAKKLQSRQAKELMDIMSGQGKYGRTAERYFDDEYMMLIGEGKSAREARRLAGQSAQRYQDDRVTYLRNAYNMYGRDGNYTNEDGLSILQQIATENPAVASIYAQAYQLPTELQNRLNTLEDKDIDQRNALAQINASGSVNSQLQREQYGYNLGLKDKDYKHDLGRIEAQGAQNRETIAFENEALYNRFVKENNYSRDEAQKAWNWKVQNLAVTGKRLGLSGDDLKSFVAAGVGINIRFGKDGKAVGKVSDDSTKSAKDMLTVLMSHRNSILSQMEKEGGGMINYEDNPELYRKLALVDERIEELTSMGIEGITGTESKGKGKDGGQKLNITGNWDNDAPIFDALSDSMKRQGFSVEQIRKGLYDIAIEHGYKPDYAMSTLGLSKDEVAKWRR